MAPRQAPDTPADPPPDRTDPPIDPDAAPPHLRPSSWLWVIAGALPGTGLRAWLEAALPTAPGGWPWATFAINTTGAFLLGLLLEGLARFGPDTGWRLRARLCAGVGFCGAYTTYSTFALEITQAVDHAVGLAVAYAVVSIAVGVLAAWLGITVAARVHGAAR